MQGTIFASRKFRAFHEPPQRACSEIVSGERSGKNSSWFFDDWYPIIRYTASLENFSYVGSATKINYFPLLLGNSKLFINPLRRRRMGCPETACGSERVCNLLKPFCRFLELFWSVNDLGVCCYRCQNDPCTFHRNPWISIGLVENYFRASALAYLRGLHVILISHWGIISQDER